MCKMSREESQGKLSLVSGLLESELNRTSARLLNINRLPAGVLNQREITCPTGREVHGTMP
jgi:hypothetical protein